MGNKDDFTVVPPEELSKYTNIKLESSHCMIYAKLPEKRVLGPKEGYLAHGAILMQMRFDGKLGFPGGLVDAGESPVEAVNREMQEEMNFDLTKHKVEQKNYVISHYNKVYDSLHHFYFLEVTECDIKSIERRCIEAKDYGDEVLGTFRVPLYTRNDGMTGFPTFLANVFVGCSFQQLIAGLKLSKLISDEAIEEAVKIATKIKSS